MTAPIAGERSRVSGAQVPPAIARGCDLPEVLRLLALVHPSGCGFVLSAILPGKGGLIARYVEMPEDIERVVRELVETQEHRKAIGVYFSLAEYDTKPIGRGTEHQACRVRCAYADVDKPTAAAARERIRAFAERTSLPPSVLISSGAGYQALWLFVGPVVVGPSPKGGEPTLLALRVRAINSALARELEGDHTIDLARIFRLPGTMNTKHNDPVKYPVYTEPLACRIVEAHPERRYAPEDLEQIVTAADRRAARKEQAKASKQTWPSPAALDLGDSELLDLARRARNGADFERLWSGDWKERYGSPSEADLALCDLLAFWTGPDPGRIDRLFRQSGLMRPKWEQRPDYRERTISKALEGCGDSYSGGQPSAHRPLNGSRPEPGPQPWDDAPPWEPGPEERPTPAGVTPAEPEVAETSPAPVVYLDLEAIKEKGIPPVPWLLRGWLAEKDIAQIVGGAGIGKSTTIAALAVSLAQGVEFCGVKPTRPLKVLYFDEEQDEATTARLFLRLGAPHPNLMVASCQGIRIDCDSGIARLEHEIATHRPDVVFIDSVQHLFGSIPEKDNTLLGLAYRILFRLRDTYLVAFMLLHHKPKLYGDVKLELVELARGGTAHGTQCSTIWYACKGDDSNQLHVVQAKRRGAKKTSLKIRYREDGPDGAITLTGEGPVADLNLELERACDWLLEHIAERGTCKVADLKKAVAAEGISESTLERALSHLLKLEKLTRPKRGWYEVADASARPAARSGGGDIRDFDQDGLDAIAELIAQNPEGLKIEDLATAADMPKSRAERYASRLEQGSTVHCTRLGKLWRPGPDPERSFRQGGAPQERP